MNMTLLGRQPGRQSAALDRLQSRYAGKGRGTSTRLRDPAGRLRSDGR